MRDLAESYKEEIREENVRAGMDRKEANSKAWEAMWVEYEPTVLKMERKKENAQRDIPEPPPAPQLKGLPEDLDSVLDTTYTETDQGKQLRDGLLWAAMEFGRVIRDEDDGPVARIDSASTPPPNAFALFTLSTYALSPIDKRRDLIARALSFATKASDPIAEPEEPTGGDSGGFLDNI